MKRVATAAVLALVVGAAVWVAWKGRSSSGTTTPSLPEGAPTYREVGATRTTPEPLESAPATSERSTIPAQAGAERKRAAVLAGMVVDQLGAPLREAQVLMIPVGPTASTESATRDEPRWGLTDRSGRFRFEGIDATRTFRLHASTQGYFDSESQTVQGGEEDLRLVLVRGRFVSGRILVDDGVPMDQLRLRLSRKSAEGRPVRWLADEEDGLLGRSPSHDGAFIFEGVSASPVELLVFVQGESIATIGGIDTKPGGAPLDPRLNPLDLRGRLNCFTIDVQDDTGGPCYGAVVALRSRDFAIDRQVMAQAGGVKFVVPHGAYDLDIEREGLRRVHLSGVAEDRVVRLRRGIAARVVVDPRPFLPPPPYRLLIALIDGTDGNVVDIDGIGALDTAGTATLLVSSPGRHNVAWYLENGNRRHFLYGITPRTVEILDRDESEEIRLDDRPEIRTSWQLKIRELEPK